MIRKCHSELRRGKIKSLWSLNLTLPHLLHSRRGPRVLELGRSVFSFRVITMDLLLISVMTCLGHFQWFEETDAPVLWN